MAKEGLLKGYKDRKDEGSQVEIWGRSITHRHRSHRGLWKASEAVLHPWPRLCSAHYWSSAHLPKSKFLHSLLLTLCTCGFIQKSSLGPLLSHLKQKSEVCVFWEERYRHEGLALWPWVGGGKSLQGNLHSGDPHGIRPRLNLCLKSYLWLAPSSSLTRFFSTLIGFSCAHILNESPSLKSSLEDLLHLPQWHEWLKILHGACYELPWYFWDL